MDGPSNHPRSSQQRNVPGVFYQGERAIRNRRRHDLGVVGGARRRPVEAAVDPGTRVTVTLTPAKSGEPVAIVKKIVNEAGESLLVEFGLNRRGFNIVKVIE